MRSRFCLTRGISGAFLLFLLLSSCGGSRATDSEPGEPAASTASDGFDACAYFSKSDAEAVLGQPVSDPKPGGYSPVPRASECTFDAVSHDPPVQILSIRVEKPANPDVTYKRLRETFSQKEVEGVGERAFSGLGQLFAFQGSHQVTVSVSPVVRQSEQRHEAAVSIAKTLLSRL